MKWFIRGILVLVASFVLSRCGIKASCAVISVLYTVLGIMFSIAMSLQMSFSFSDVENDSYVSKQRKQLNKLRTIFIILFFIATLCFIFSGNEHQFSYRIFHLDMDDLYAAYMIFCLLSFIYNFNQLSKVKEEIDDAIRKEKKDNKKG